MKTISHKAVVLCQCINVDVNPLLAYLGAWILALLDHLSQLTYGFTLHFELKKMKVFKIEKINGNQSCNASRERLCISCKHTENQYLKNPSIIKNKEANN